MFFICCLFNFLCLTQELREKNWKAMEALEKAEKSAAEKLDKCLKSSRVISLFLVHVVVEHISVEIIFIIVICTRCLCYDQSSVLRHKQ